MNNIDKNFNNLNTASFYEGILNKDLDYINSRKDDVVAGFLSIGSKQGWTQGEEGNTSEAGFRFTRYMFRKFYNESRFVDFQEILKNVCKAMVSIPESQSDGHPARATVDASITGWDKHCVTRIVSAVAVKASSNGPYM